MQLDRTLFRSLSGLRLSTPQRATGRAQGDRRSPFRGQGVEFADYRPYTPGDDLRRVDWNVYARLQTLLVRLFHEDRVLSVAVCLDATASMDFGNPTKLVHGGHLAASIALLGLLKRDRVTLCCVGGTGPQKPVHGQQSNNFSPMLDLLERTEAKGDTLPMRALEMLRRGGKRDRLFFVSDMLHDLDVCDHILKRLANTAHRPVLLHTLSNEELSPDLSQPLRATDAETGEVLTLQGGRQATKRYAEALQRYRDQLEARCRAYRVQYVPAFTTVSMRDVLTRVLPQARVVEHIGGAAS